MILDWMRFIYLEILKTDHDVCYYYDLDLVRDVIIFIDKHRISGVKGQGLHKI